MHLLLLATLQWVSLNKWDSQVQGSIDRVKKLHNSIYHALCEELLLGQPTYEDAATAMLREIRLLTTEEMYYRATLKDIRDYASQPSAMAKNALSKDWRGS